MDHVGIESIKEAYGQQLIKNNIADAATIINGDITEPIFRGFSVHPESVPVLKDINKAFTDIHADILALDKEISNTGASYARMIKDMDKRLSIVENDINSEVERLQDINIICGNYSEFATVVPLSRDNFGGEYNIKDSNTFTSKILQHAICPAKILSITGNGYEGNHYVYKNDQSLDETIDASKQGNIIDGNLGTYYEYSRLTSSPKEKLDFLMANKDNKEALCTIEMHSDTQFNCMHLNLEGTVTVEDVLTSDNGVNYSSCLKKPIEITNKIKQYTDAYYAYGSDYICFPKTNYVKVTLQSKGAQDEDIRYLKGDIVYQFLYTKRHVIRIADITLENGQYQPASYMKTNDLISDPIECIAVFSNEYIPPEYDSKTSYFEYTLTINGKDYSVIPINSQSNGIKLIRHATYESNNSYILHINEPIRQASLKIAIKSDGNSTPFLTNIKLCKGKAAIK